MCPVRSLQVLGEDGVADCLESFGVDRDARDTLCNPSGIFLFSRVLKNVMSAGKTRQNPTKKRSLWLINEDFESDFNAVWSGVIVFTPSPFQAARNALAIAVQQLVKRLFKTTPCFWLHRGYGQVVAEVIVDDNSLYFPAFNHRADQDIYFQYLIHQVGFS